MVVVGLRRKTVGLVSTFDPSVALGWFGLVGFDLQGLIEPTRTEPNQREGRTEPCIVTKCGWFGS